MSDPRINKVKQKGEK